MQCRRLSVWNVYFNFNTLTWQNYFFPECMGVYVNLCKFRRGGGLFLCSINGKSGEEGGGGACKKFPLWWGHGYFLDLHNVNFTKKIWG